MYFTFLICFDLLLSVVFLLFALLYLLFHSPVCGASIFFFSKDSLISDKNQSSWLYGFNGTTTCWNSPQDACSRALWIITKDIENFDKAGNNDSENDHSNDDLEDPVGKLFIFYYIANLWLVCYYLFIY